MDIYVAILPMALIAATIYPLKNDAFVWATWLDETVDLILGFLLVLFPWIPLSVLNRFLFGRIICVLDDKGLHHKGGFIPWQHIEQVIYEVEVPSRHWEFCRAIIHSKAGELTLNHAPYFLLKKIKRHTPDIPVRLSKSSVFAIVFFAVFPSAAMLFIMLVS